MDNESSYATETAMVDEGSFLTDNLVPLMVTTGCVTAGLLGTLFAVKNESKKRYDRCLTFHNDNKSFWITACRSHS